MMNINKWIASVFPVPNGRDSRVKRANAMKYIPYIRFPVASYREYQFYKIWFLAAIIVCGVLKAGETSGQEPASGMVVSAKEDSNPVSAARDFVLSYFYPASRLISEVKENRIVVNLRSDKKFKKGARFSVFREGKPFYHPVTKEPIGKSEEFIGKIEIEEVVHEVYLCRVVRGSAAVNDIVRITSSPVKIAFFQDKKAEWMLSDVFYNYLKDSGRFDFIEFYTKTYDPKELSKLAKDAGAEAVLLLSTPVKDKKMFLNIKLFWSEDAWQFAEIEKTVESDTIKELTSEDKYIPIISTEGLPWGSYSIAKGRFIAMGDVDGNGEKELIGRDGKAIRIYSYKNEPQEIWSLKGGPDEMHLSIDVLEVNNNGR